jgi:hypothetical protein
MCIQCGCGKKMGQGRGIPQAASVPTYDPMAKPWTSHEEMEDSKEK